MSSATPCSIATLEKKMKYWEDQQHTFKEIYSKGMVAYIKNNQCARKAFACNDGCLCCVDEGTFGQEHLAGAGILWEDREKLKQYIRKAKIKKISSHENCGAAKIYTQLHNLDENKSDEYAVAFAKTLAEEMGLKWEHFSLEKMNRPEEFHISRIIYYDATNHFNYILANCFPPGLEVSRGLCDKKNALAELKLCIQIILDNDNGYGQLITEETPIVICPIASGNNDELDRATLTEEIANFILKLGGDQRRRILVSGFTQPKLNLFDIINQQQYFKVGELLKLNPIAEKVKI